jgi:hypothetical protein
MLRSHDLSQQFSPKTTENAMTTGMKNNVADRTDLESVTLTTKVRISTQVAIPFCPRFGFFYRKRKGSSGGK